jgi:hypothetical protein
MLDNGTWISWWPDLTRASCYGPICDAPALWPDFARDNQAEGTVPTVTHLGNLDEEAIQKWWDAFQRDHIWHTFSQNCSTTVMEALDAGGGRTKAPLAPRHPFLWTPPDVQDYANDIQKAGKGVYLPFLVPRF